MENAIARNTTELEQLECVIERGLSTFYEVGRALMRIRDKQLYEKVRGFATFESYCNERWGFSASRARQLVAAAETYDALKTVTNVTPINEGQTRPLMSLTTEKKQQVWQKAVETAPEGKVTAAHVSKVVKEITGEPHQPQKDDIAVINESRNLSNIKNAWNTCNTSDKRAFIKWGKEYFNCYFK